MKDKDLKFYGIMEFGIFISSIVCFFYLKELNTSLLKGIVGAILNFVVMQVIPGLFLVADFQDNASKEEKDKLQHMNATVPEVFR